MQTVALSLIREGTFVKELKNRFLCEVIIDNEVTVCYVPSSCHLSHFINLEGKKVLLKENNATSARTKYALYAIPYKNNYIVLNTSAANVAFESSILTKKFSYLGFRKDYIREHYIQNYKCDFFLPKEHSIIEIKSLLSTDKHAQFPTVYSQRTIEQLNQLLLLLNQGYHAYFYIISLHPYVSDVHIQPSSAFYSCLKECIESGLIVKACTIRTSDMGYKVDKHIPLSID